MATHHLVGVKPYPNLAAEALGKGVNDVTPLDLLTPGQLEVLDRAKGIATVHIPRKERLADPVNQAEMPELCRRAPDTTFVFAHIGRAYFMRNVVGMLDKLAECPNAWLDTAMVNHPGVLKYALITSRTTGSCWFRRSNRMAPWQIRGNQQPICVPDGRGLQDRNLDFQLRVRWNSPRSSTNNSGQS